MKKFLIVAISERDLDKIQTADTYEQAIDVANELLQKRMEAIGCEKEFLTGDEEGAEWMKASEKSDGCAWCNFHGNWDAHVVEIEI